MWMISLIIQCIHDPSMFERFQVTSAAYPVASGINHSWSRLSGPTGSLQVVHQSFHISTWWSSVSVDSGKPSQRHWKCF